VPFDWVDGKSRPRRGRRHSRSGRNQKRSARQHDVTVAKVEALMVAFAMIVHEELDERATEVPLESLRPAHRDGDKQSHGRSIRHKECLLPYE
jgi:hypothetical protein